MTLVLSCPLCSTRHDLPNPSLSQTGSCKLLAVRSFDPLSPCIQWWNAVQLHPLSNLHLLHPIYLCHVDGDAARSSTWRNETRVLSPKPTPTKLSKMPREFQFVAVLRPTEPVPFETRKLTHSHARRETHAMKKRLRMQRVQAKATQARAGNVVVVFGPPFLGLPSSIVSSRKDIFSILPRPLSHQEHFLLDHCMPRRQNLSRAIFSAPPIYLHFF